MPRRMPEEYTSRVDETQWGRNFNIGNEEDHTAPIVTGYILYRTMCYQEEDYNDDLLWEYFKEDFQDWTREIFNLGDIDSVRRLRTHLRANGVYIPRDGKRIAENITAVLNTHEYHEWTEAETNEELKLNKPFNSKWNPSHRPLHSTPPQPISQPNYRQQGNASPYETLLNSPFNQPWNRTANDVPENRPVREEATRYEAQELPNLSRQLADLMMIYHNDEKKFGGEMYDVLDNKLRIFNDCCVKVGIRKVDYHQAYSIMLKKRAADFYYDKLADRNYDFSDMIRMTKAHFETDENRQLYLSEWRTTTLLKVISDNPDKNRLECLQILFDTLQKVQRGLSVVYQAEYSLREQVINACRDISECNLAMFNPADTYEGVCAQLRSLIGTAMRTRESQQRQQFNVCSDDNDNGDRHEQNWTDRTYGGRGGGLRGNFRNSLRGFRRDQ